MKTADATSLQRHEYQRRSLGFLALIVSLASILSGCNWVATTSVSNTGEQGNDGSILSSLSADGRIVAFVSVATNLDSATPVVNADPVHIYVHDARLGTTKLVSANSFGIEGDDYSFAPAVSGNGRYIAYQSLADNLVPGDNNGVYDIFVYDRETSLNTRISPTTRDGMDALFNSVPSISHDGRYITYFTQARNPDVICCSESTIVVYDQNTGVTRPILITGEDSTKRYWKYNPSISGDGRFIAFEYRQDVSAVPVEIMVHDRDTGTTSRVSISSAGDAPDASSVYPAISADGRYVAFASIATNLVDGDDNGMSDIFVHDHISATTNRVNVDNEGNEANLHSRQPAISGDGRYITFMSEASNLVDDDSNGVVDAFLHDRQSGTTRRVSLSPTGAESDGESYEPVAISTDGRYVSFASDATNLMANDNNGYADVFLRAVPQISVTSVIPSHLPIGSTTSVTVTGTDFLNGARPLLGAWIRNVVIVDENTITMDVTVPAYMPSGARTIMVSLNGTGPGALSGASGICHDCVTFF